MGGKWAAFSAALIIVVLSANVLYAQGQPPRPPQRPVSPPPNNSVEVSKEKMEKAGQRGMEFLRSQQKSDGSWDYVDGPFYLNMPGVDTHLTMGCTALCCLATSVAIADPANPSMKC